MRAYGTAGLVAARGTVEVPTTPLVRPAHWPARIPPQSREVRSPVADALAARTPQDRAAERALAATRAAETEAARKARRRRGKEPTSRTPKGTDDVDALREALLADVRRRVTAGETDDVIAAALRVSTRSVKDLRALAGAYRGTPRRAHGSRLLDEIAAGGTVQEIAARVPCSPSTVIRARARIRAAAAETAPHRDHDGPVDDAGTLPEVEAGLAQDDAHGAAVVTDLHILDGRGPRTPEVGRLLAERFGPVPSLRRERVSAGPPHDSPGAVAARRRALARATDEEERPC